LILANLAFGGIMIFSRVINFNVLVLVTLFMFLSACQSTSLQRTNIQPNYSDLYLDDAFKQKHSIESAEEVFAIDDEMKRMVTEKLLPIRNSKERAKELLMHLFSKENINLAYKNSANLTAIEAYHNHMANCMSLTIMAYALANEAELDVKFQDVKVPEYWVRNGQYNMLTGHVNLVLTEPRNPGTTIVYGKDLLQIDFDPTMYKNSFPKKIVEKSTVLAMFYNNKGAEALIAKKYALAYSYLREATIVDPMFSPAWGNLGILYKLNDHRSAAKKTYQHAILLDKDNLTALSNLSYLAKAEGDIEQVQKIEHLLHEKRNKNPYYHALLADEAFFRGQNTVALKLYKKAIRMNKKVHEFYFGLAKVYYSLDDIPRAERAMKKALLYNKTSTTEHQYLAKLDFLRQVEVRH